jgi:hypothetical protein
MKSTPGDATDTVERLRTGGRRALATIFDGYRDRLRRMVELRIDPRLRARIDASDVLQEAFIDVARDLDAYLADPKLPPLLWLRLHVGRRLARKQGPETGTRLVRCRSTGHKRRVRGVVVRSRAEVVRDRSDLRLRAGRWHHPTAVFAPAGLGRQPTRASLGPRPIDWEGHSPVRRRSTTRVARSAAPVPVLVLAWTDRPSETRLPCFLIEVPARSQ